MINSINYKLGNILNSKLKLLFIVVISFVLMLQICQPVEAVEAEKFEESSAEEAGLSTETDAGALINQVNGYIAAILAGLFVLMMLIGSIMYMVYSDTEKKQKGMVLIQSAIIAAIIALLSYTVWKLITNILDIDVPGGSSGSSISPGVR